MIWRVVDTPVHVQALGQFSGQEHGDRAVESELAALMGLQHQRGDESLGDAGNEERGFGTHGLPETGVTGRDDYPLGLVTLRHTENRMGETPLVHGAFDQCLQPLLLARATHGETPLSE